VITVVPNDARRRLPVFVDFENLFSSLKNRSELSGHRIRDIGLSILDRLKTRLQSEGSPMVLGRSYAAFDCYPGMEVAHDLALMGFDPQYVLVGPSGKNSADVQLAVDVCRVLFRRPDIGAIVIVSGDRDFIPIARQVLEENRELRLVAIPDATSGDLRMRVGAERCWNALDLLPTEPLLPSEPLRREVASPSAAEPELLPAHAGEPNVAGIECETVPPIESAGPESGSLAHAAAPEHARPGRAAAIVGHIPVTWRTTEDAPEQALLERLSTCLDLLVKSQIRHGSREIWLSPFLKGPMSQHFSGLVHPERRALINELRNRGVIRIEERENQFADHPYSVIVLADAHPLVRAAYERARKG
jgi:hypothetical protein